VRFNQRKSYGDPGRLKTMHRRYLVDSPMLEIVLAYNAEIRGLANCYRLACVAKFSLRKLWFLWETRLLKTLAFRLRLSVNQVAHRLKTRDGLAVRFKVDRKQRSVAVVNLKHIDRSPNPGRKLIAVQSLSLMYDARSVSRSASQEVYYVAISRARQQAGFTPKMERNCLLP
jgi:RNA-directed DNA polymerase